MIPREIVWAILSLFPISEIVLGTVKRAKEKDASVEDRGTLRLLWLVISASVILAIAASEVPLTRFHLSVQVTDCLSIIFTISGMTLRWISIRTLGRYFTVNVAIHPGQQVVRSGPYRYIRHPSYTGMLLAFLGLGIYFANWMSIIVLLFPVTLATLNRIRREEDALKKALGAPYLAYCAETRRLLPWIY